MNYIKKGINSLDTYPKFQVFISFQFLKFNMHKINLPWLLLFFYESVETTQQNPIQVVQKNLIASLICSNIK